MFVRGWLVVSVVPLVNGFPAKFAESCRQQKNPVLMSMATPMASQGRTPFQIFQDHNLERIGESDRQGINNLSENVHATTVLQPIISWSEIQRLASSQDSTSLERLEFAQKVASTGSFVLLELDDTQAAIVEDMWESMEAFFDQVDERDLHHQTIARERDAHEDLGYKFIQTYNTPGDVVLPTTIQDTLGYSVASGRGASASFLSFAEIAETVATVLSAGVLKEDPNVMKSVVEGLLHSSTTRFASANHRLSRYVLTQSENDPIKESLRAHTDWTLTTPIPLSATPGLQLWKPDTEQWVAPESLVQDLPLARTRYVLVMAGKWMELLTNQGVLACIHRVVCKTSQAPRLSAPFFLRPKEVVFQSLSDEFNSPLHVSETMSPKDATTAIHSMFQGYIAMTTRSLHP